MSVAPSVQIAEALDYSPKEYSAGNYVLRNVNPENGQPVIQLNSTINTDFLLPSVVSNLSESSLDFNYYVSEGAQNTFTSIHNGFLSEIDGLILSTASGVRICELNEVPAYTKLVWRPETDFQDFLSFPRLDVKATVAASLRAGGKFEHTKIISANGTAANYNAGGLHSLAIDGSSTENDDNNILAMSNMRSTGVASDVAPGAATLAGVQAVRVSFPLKLLYGTIFAQNKDLYFKGEQLRLTVRWNNGSKWGYVAAAGLGVSAADIATAPTISNVVLRLAVQKNDALVNALIAQVNSAEGINIRMPFTYSYKSVGSAGASIQNNVIRRLNRGHGAKCKRIIAGLAMAVQTGNRYMTFNNHTGLLWANYRTFLDSKPLQDDVMLVSDYTAFRYHKNKLVGSVLKGGDEWAQVPALIEDFSGVPLTKDYPKTDHMSAGLDLSVEREFVLQFTNCATDPGALNVYLFAQCEKQLSINASGISVQ